MNKLDKLQILNFFLNFGPFWPTLARSPHRAWRAGQKLARKNMGQTGPTHFGPQPEWVGPARFPAIVLGYQGNRVIGFCGFRVLVCHTARI